MISEHMVKKIKIFTMCFAFLLVFFSFANAHPHVFITQRINVVFDDKGLAGFKMQWIFDDMFASMITGDYDKNQNGFFEENEIAVIKNQAFTYVSNYDYFTFVKIDGKPFKVKFIKNFTAKLLESKKIMYEFFIPCHITAIKTPKQVTVATYDPTYYSAIFFAKKNSSSLVNTDAFEVNTAIKQDPSASIYYGQVKPWALFLDFRLK